MSYALYHPCSAFSSIRQVTASDETFGSTPLVAPLLPDGSTLLLASHAPATVVQASWALYSAASTVALGVAANTSAPAPAVCGQRAPAAWTYVINAMSGSQVREAGAGERGRAEQWDTGL